MAALSVGDGGFSPLPFSALEGFAADDHAEAFAVFRRTFASRAEGGRPLRPALAATSALTAIGQKALSLPSLGAKDARRFFEAHFQPARTAAPGFFTGYYEPIVDGALTRTAAFTTPILSRPADLDARGAPPRADIEAGALEGRARPIVFVRDPVEAFLIHVQGSARVRLGDGRLLRLVYDGRNGRPYQSIGRVLIDSGAIAPAAMSLAALKAWIRAHGQAAGEAGAGLMQRNESYIFFRLDAELDPPAGPIGGAGVSLAPLRSLAVDRALHAYGTPIWIDAELPWRRAAATRFHRLMIAQDTGSAIIGATRADIFFGSGEAAGAQAAGVRHGGDFIVFLPIEEGSVR